MTLKRVRARLAGCGLRRNRLRARQRLRARHCCRRGNGCGRGGMGVCQWSLDKDPFVAQISAKREQGYELSAYAAGLAPADQP